MAEIWLRQLYEAQIPPPEEEEKRKTIVKKLKRVYDMDSDIDAVCITPSFVDMANDFFILLPELLRKKKEVSYVYCVKNARIPLIRLVFNGILVDLPYAQLQLASIPHDLDVCDPYFLTCMDETSRKCLSGVFANRDIVRSVPSLESLLKCLKLWAKRRGVYGNLNGFLGGVHMAVLAAFICRYEAKATLDSLLAAFFYTFAHWRWPLPVILRSDYWDIASPPGLMRSDYWATASTPSLMPIQLPCGPLQYCNSNITRSTFYKITAELMRGHNLTKDYMNRNFSWKVLFEPYPYANKCTKFIKIHLSAANHVSLNNWILFVKSRFPRLLIKIEEAYGICDPNPAEYVETHAEQPGIAFYWGLRLKTKKFTKLKESYFLTDFNVGSFDVPVGGIQLSIVNAAQLPKNSTCATSNRSEKVTKACWRIREDKECKNVPDLTAFAALCGWL